MNSKKPAPQGYHAWTHRLATLLILIVFPLIWVGGLVTTYDAGMAVPDWPNTYGYNLFLYPVYDWFFGPWDLFVEHGHRLLASLAGLVTVILAVVAWRSDSRAWFRQLAVLTVGLVVLQGVLGGVRVLLANTNLAMVHGCTGPIYFVMAVALWVLSSRWWHRNSDSSEDRLQRTASNSIIWASSIMLVGCTGQLVLGANLRHIAVDASPSFYQNLVVAHVLMAIAILIGSIMLAFLCLLKSFRRFGFGRYGVGLIVCVLIQISLGIGTWIVKYGWPYILGDLPFAAQFVVGEKNFVQMNIVTGHVAIGSLILAILTFILCRSIRVTEFRRREVISGNHAMEISA